MWYIDRDITYYDWRCGFHLGFITVLCGRPKHGKKWYLTFARPMWTWQLPWMLKDAKQRLINSWSVLRRGYIQD